MFLHWYGWTSFSNVGAAWTYLVQTKHAGASHPACSLTHFTQWGAARVPSLSAYRFVKVVNRSNSFRSAQSVLHFVQE